MKSVLSLVLLCCLVGCGKSASDIEAELRAKRSLMADCQDVLDDYRDELIGEIWGVTDSDIRASQAKQDHQLTLELLAQKRTALDEILEGKSAKALIYQERFESHHAFKTREELSGKVVKLERQLIAM